MNKGAISQNIVNLSQNLIQILSDFVSEFEKLKKDTKELKSEYFWNKMHKNEYQMISGFEIDDDVNPRAFDQVDDKNYVIDFTELDKKIRKLKVMLAIEDRELIRDIYLTSLNSYEQIKEKMTSRNDDIMQNIKRIEERQKELVPEMRKRSLEKETLKEKYLAKIRDLVKYLDQVEVASLITLYIKHRDNNILSSLQENYAKKRQVLRRVQSDLMNTSSTTKEYIKELLPHSAPIDYFLDQAKRTYYLILEKSDKMNELAQILKLQFDAEECLEFYLLIFKLAKHLERAEQVADIDTDCSFVSKLFK